MTLLYLGAFHTARSAGPMVPVAAFAVGGRGDWGDSSRRHLPATFEVLLWPCLIVLVVDVWLIAMILFAVRTRDYP